MEIIVAPTYEDLSKQAAQEDASVQLPASLLRQHPGLKIYLDAEAAQLILY